MASITCQDCGDRRTNCPRNTRRCKLCRLVFDLDYWRVRRRPCKDCKNEFAPINRNDYHCSKCDPGLRYYPATCKLIFPKENGHDGLLAIVGVPICAGCLRHPKRRRGLITALANGQAARRKKNGWKPPTP